MKIFAAVVWILLTLVAGLALLSSGALLFNVVGYTLLALCGLSVASLFKR